MNGFAYLISPIPYLHPSDTAPTSIHSDVQYIDANNTLIAPGQKKFLEENEVKI